MKNLFVIVLTLFAFVSSNTENNTSEGAHTGEEVYIKSGNEISLKLDYESDSSEAFEVDIVFSATEANDKGQ